MIHLLGANLAQLLDVLFPPRCMGCDEVLAGETFFCERCELGVEAIGPNACSTCGEPGLYKSGRCPRCIDAPWRVRRASAPFLHEAAVARAVHRFKYEDHPELAAPLARWVLEELGPERLCGYDGICPIPLHASRFRSRRYDQATLLAAAWAKMATVPLRLWLAREKATQRQVGLSDVQREANVRGAFTASPLVAGKTVLLVDDVLTTGATANAAAHALYQAGAHAVDLLTVARARKSSA